MVPLFILLASLGSWSPEKEDNLPRLRHQPIGISRLTLATYSISTSAKQTSGFPVWEHRLEMDGSRLFPD